MPSNEPNGPKALQAQNYVIIKRTHVRLVEPVDDTGSKDLIEGPGTTMPRVIKSAFVSRDSALNAGMLLVGGELG